MEMIAHRVNTVKELRQLSPQYGAELDLRDDLEGNIYISHNPFEAGDSFDEYLSNYHHGTMILNIKSERIELKILELLQRHNIDKYFFLDSSFPMIYLLSKRGNRNVALRYSEYEGLDTIRNMQGLVDWIWVDCFSKIPLDYAAYREMKLLGYKLCFVSPELQGRPEDILRYKELLKREKIVFDAICTKKYNIDKWI